MASRITVRGAPDPAQSEPARRQNYDLFADLSASELNSRQLQEYLRNLLDHGPAPHAESSILLAVPEAPELAKPSIDELAQPSADVTIVRTAPAKAADAFYRACARAARQNRHLVVVLGELLPAHEVVKSLIDEFDRDPLLGTTQPRFFDATNDQAWPLPGRREGDPGRKRLNRDALALLPPSTITAELLAACFVIRREVVAEIDKLDYGLESTLGTLRLLLCQMRRRGFRNVIVNHLALGSHLPYGRIYPSPPTADADRLRRIYPDIARADEWNANLSQLNLETVLANVPTGSTKAPRHLLLDCRGLIARHNGTSSHIHGLLGGFHTLDTTWQFDILSNSDAAEFHQLRKRYPKFKLLTGHPRDTYPAAVLLNQPRTLSIVDELHRHALLIAFNMLDTISWDVLYETDANLDPLWRFVAAFSDCLFFNSEFTRERFTTRFPSQQAMAECVTYLSMSQDEQVDTSAKETPLGEHILVFGNEYDHKDVRRTAQLLAKAFPFAKIVAFGIADAGVPGVSAIPSGQLGETALHLLIAGARLIVFPSFYEGFGMPVVEGLAYGRPVLVRESPLWREIAGRLRLPGQLVPFTNTASLVEAVGCALAGLPLNPLPQGGMLGAGESPLSWRDCAQRMIDSFENLLPAADGKRWQKREEALQSIRLLRV